MTDSAESILSRLRVVLPPGQQYGLHQPEFSGREREYVIDCLESTFVSSVGKYVDHFEEMLQEITGAARAVAVVNGTCGLHAALVLSGVSFGDEILMPALTFVGTANAVSMAGGVCHFVDSEETSLGVDPEKLDRYLNDIGRFSHGQLINRFTERPIKAIIPVHIFGHPADLDSLAEVSSKYALTMIEDAAEALGSQYRGRHVGHHGRLSVLSFNGNKTITTGGGGAILTDDVELGNLVKHVTNTAKMPHPWEFNHDRYGFNYRMPNINAALGCGQLEMLGKYLENKRKLAERYRKAFVDVDGVEIITEPDYAISNYWLNALIFGKPDRELRDEMLAITNENSIMTRPLWTPMNHLPMYADCPYMDLSVSESLLDRVINLPSSVTI